MDTDTDDPTLAEALVAHNEMDRCLLAAETARTQRDRKILVLYRAGWRPVDLGRPFGLSSSGIREAVRRALVEEHGSQRVAV